MKSALLLLIILFITHILQAENILPKLDSIGLERKNNRLFLLYKVEQGETLTSIAKKYHLTVDDLKVVNDDKKNGIEIGSIIRVPYTTSTTTYATNQSKPSQNTAITEKSVHIVRKGETLTMIAKIYGVSVAEIKETNNLDTDLLSLNQPLIIEKTVETSHKTPTYKTTVVKEENKNVKNDEWLRKPAVEPEKVYQNKQPVFYVVKEKETLLSVAEKNKINIDSVRRWNKLKADKIKVGEQLIVGYLFKDKNGEVVLRWGGEPIKKPIENTLGTNKQPDYMANQKSDSQTGMSLNSNEREIDGRLHIINMKLPEPHSENIKASVLSGEEQIQQGLIALHHSARVGSYLQVVSPATGSKITVKVVGKLDKTEVNKTKVMIKLSKLACQKLNITEQMMIDKSFNVVVNYNE